MFSASDGTERIVEILTKLSPPNGGDWTHEVKERVLYPATEALHSLDPEDALAVAQQLASQGNGSGYGAAKLLLAGKKRVTELPIFLPIDTFDPQDIWGWYFRKGLSMLSVANKAVCEVGVGSGAAAIEWLKATKPPKRLVLIDRDPHVLEVARLNITINCGKLIEEKGIIVEYFAGDVDTIFKQFAESLDEYKFDFIVGCLPQVPAHGDNLDLWQTDAHEYDEGRYPEFEYWGLGLLFATQELGKKLLANKKSRIVLVHSGRIPNRVREEFHQKLGVEVSRTLVKEMVSHCPTTPLNYLFDHADGESILFFEPEVQGAISPEEAEKVRQSALDDNPKCISCGIYHFLYVLETMVS